MHCVIYMTCVLNGYSTMSCVLAHIVFCFRVFTPIHYEPYVCPVALDSHLWTRDVGLVDISMTNLFCSYGHMLI